MLRKVSSKFEMSFERSGGAIIVARVDIWQPTEEQWRQVAVLEFKNPLKTVEKIKEKLGAGQYTCVFQCFVQESLNGRYDFGFAVDGKPTFIDTGDVNTTAASDDSKVFKDQFILEVQAGKQR
jgi:hypothetical protein